MPTSQELQQQISTLTTALATLTEERAKMETSYQEDKKTLLAQQDSLVRQVQLERETAESNIRQLQKQLEDVSLERLLYCHPPNHLGNPPRNLRLDYIIITSSSRPRDYIIITSFSRPSDYIILTSSSRPSTT